MTKVSPKKREEPHLRLHKPRLKSEISKILMTKCVYMERSPEESLFNPNSTHFKQMTLKLQTHK